jgi:hypothetical protein
MLAVFYSAATSRQVALSGDTAKEQGVRQNMSLLAVRLKLGFVPGGKRCHLESPSAELLLPLVTGANVFRRNRGVEPPKRGKECLSVADKLRVRVRLGSLSGRKASLYAGNRGTRICL